MGVTDHQSHRYNLNTCKVPAQKPQPIFELTVQITHCCCCCLQLASYGQDLSQFLVRILASRSCVN